MSNINLTPEQAYEHFLTIATFDPAAIVPFRTDAHLAQHNAMRGLEAVLEHEARITVELPAVVIDELREVLPLTHAVVFAAARVNRTPEATMLRDLMPEAYRLRRRMLTSALALSEAGLIPEREVTPIRDGRGQIDAAQDLPQLAALHRRHATAIEGKHPVTKEDLERADQLGTQLLEILRPSGASSSKQGSSELAAAMDARDRLWTLLTKRHEQVWKVGAWLFGYDVEAKVPYLQSRKLKRKAAETPAQPETPTEGPVPA